MHYKSFFRASFLRIVAVMLLVAVLLPAPAFSLDSEDSQIFISGFNAYQRKDYKTTIENMSSLLKKYPDSSLKDMTIFWLARASYKAGHRQEAAKYMAQFFRDYPDSPLKGTVEDELVALAQSYQKGEPLDVVSPKQDQASPAGKADAEKTPVAGGVASEKMVAEPAGKSVTDQADADRVAAERAATERAATERAATERAATERAATQKKKSAATKKSKMSDKRSAKSVAMRNKAIAGYKAVIDKYPGTAAASSASAKLHQLGIEYPAAAKNVVTAPHEGEVTQVFNLEVAQFADVELKVGHIPEVLEAGKRFSIPFDITNAGNGSDAFHLQAGFPAQYNFHFAAAVTPGVVINSTPTLAVGERFRAVAVGTMPRGNIDGQKDVFPIRAVSAFAREASQSKEIVLTCSAPLLRAVVKSDKAKLLPGEKISYRVSLLNIGSGNAGAVTLKLNYPPQYEPVNIPTAFKSEGDATLALDALQLKSGDSKDFSLTFLLKDDALAEQELFLRADVTNKDLDKKESFVSAASVVQRVSGVTARITADKLVVIPGQVVSIPVVVTNTGNLREVFAIKASVPGNASYTFYDDLNRDGKRQANEPVVNHVGPMSPKEEAYVLLEIATPVSANDGSVAPVSVFFEPENSADRSTTVRLQLVYSRPILELTMASKAGRAKPGEVSSLELYCLNRGSNMAKQVVLQSILPPQLELVAADPPFTRADNGIYLWAFDELGAGEKRDIKVTYKVRPGIAVGTSMQLKNLLSYHDQIGNRY